MTKDQADELAKQLGETLSIDAGKGGTGGAGGYRGLVPDRPPTVLQRTNTSVESALASLLAHRADLEKQINELYGKRIETDRAILALKTAIEVMGR